tara:strand:+ start:681 stop:968 length:288 start_codon:yes stop_codon:yes gene_type:complete
MSKVFYNKTTGDGAVFDDDENVLDWPDFQEAQLDVTSEALAADARLQRDGLLSSSDQYGLVDRITDAWLSYRVLLRDLPEQEGFPTTITWPTKPT